MQKSVLSLAIQLACFILAMGLLFALASVTQAQGPVGDCNGGVLFKDQFGKTYCISQPDPFPTLNRQTRSPLASTPPITTAPTPVICDGDGTTGFRIQVIYAYINANVSRFTTYRASLQYWAYGVDKDMVDSGAATGGVRHVRYVTEMSGSTCYPNVIEVALPATILQGTNTQRFSKTITELQKLGYSALDRNYMVFVDAQLGSNNICGVGTVQYDDSPAQTNMNNVGPNYVEIDDNCWSSVIPGHELMHNLGGVQFSAPHSDGNYHCVDGYDNMCDHGGSPALAFTICPNSVGDHLLDCNHDDYFNTNPPATSYLATHWNAANNRFLIYGNQPAMRVDSMLTGNMNGTVFAPTDMFNPNDTAVVRLHVVDTNGVNISGANVSFAINQPNGSAQCVFTNRTTDSNGYAQAACLIPSNAAGGTWNSTVSNLTRASFSAASFDSVTQHRFTVNASTPTAVTLSSLTARVDGMSANSASLPSLVAASLLTSLIVFGVFKARTILAIIKHQR